MSDTVNKPMLSDETGQQILEALQAISLKNGAQREVLQEIKAVLQEISGKVGGVSELLCVPMTAEVTEQDDAGAVTKVTCALDGVTFEDIESAHGAGKTIVAVISDATGAVYNIPLSAVASSDTYTAYRFESTGSQNPAGRPCLVQVIKMTATGKVSVTCSINRINARNISCDVTIDGVQYTDLDSALTALAGG